MTAMLSEVYVPRSPDALIRDSLQRIEHTLAALGVPLNPAACRTLLEEMRQLHMRFRSHDAATHIDPACMTATPSVPPQLYTDLKRVRAEHPHLLGLLDWLIRYADSISNQSEEDQEVYILRAREMIAVFRRHEAEEDRIFFRSAWEDTGGEGG